MPSKPVMRSPPISKVREMKVRVARLSPPHPVCKSRSAMEFFSKIEFPLIAGLAAEEEACSV